MPPSTLIPPEAPTIPLKPVGGQDGQSSVSVKPASQVDGGCILCARYQLIELIGEGGMSRVFKALDLRRQAERGDDSFIAVKVMKGAFGKPADRFDALCAHVHQWRRLAHPAIARLIDCEHDRSIVFITMEHLTGESVYAKLHKRRAAVRASRSPRDREEARLIITAVADALGYAHEHGVVHGDVKPGNVIVTEHGEVKVIDFGMARWLAAAVTPSYASPQLLAGEPPAPSDDVFSLSCLAYEILTGFHPFEGGAGASSQRTAPPLRPGLTPGEHAALVHGLAPDRSSRTPSVHEFMSEFAPPPRRSPPGRWPLWAAAAAVAVIGWIMLRPAPKSTATAPTASSAPPARHVPNSSASTGDKPGALIRDCPTCPAMIVLPPGQFQQGSATDDPNALSFEKPRHPVRIAYPLAMSVTDITVADYRQFISAIDRDMQGCAIYDGGEWRRRSAASWQDPGFAQSATHPATCISWNDAVAYTEWLSGKTGHRYRLPSASEWEYAARAGGDSVRPWDAAGNHACANANVADQSAERRYPGWSVFPCDDGYVNTAPVASFRPNSFGLSDMLGNVFVWTQDCWQPDYVQAPSDGSALELRSCRDHELRGGSWFSAPSTVKASYRNHFAAGYRTSSVGFRVVRDED